MNLTLYEIAETYRHALTALEDMDLSPETVTDTLDGLAGDLQVTATNIAKFVKNLEGLAAQIKEEETHMAHRRKRLDERAQAIREYIKGCMETAGITKIDCPFFQLSIKKNPPAVEIINENLVPSDLMRVPPPPAPVPDLKQISQMLKVDGACAYARLVQATRLEIK